jgi:hypothetical protein
MDDGLEVLEQLQAMIRDHKLPPRPQRPLTLREAKPISLGNPFVKGVRAAVIEFFKKNDNRPATLRQIQEGIGATDGYTIATVLYGKKKHAHLERVGTLDGKRVLWRLSSVENS